MKYRRALILAEPGADVEVTAAAVRRVAPELERAVVMIRPRGFEAWWSREREREPEASELRGVPAWHAAGATLAQSAEVYEASDASIDALVELGRSEGVDLLVAGVQTLDASVLLAGAARRLGIALLWPVPSDRAGPVAQLLCVALGERGRASVAAFLQSHMDPSIEATVIGPAPSAAAHEWGGIRARVRLMPRPLLASIAALEWSGRRAAIDLVVVPRVPAPLLFGFGWPAPVLMLPLAERGDSRARPLDVADVANIDGTIRARISEVTPVGTLALATDVALVFVSEGRVVARAQTSECGEVELPVAESTTTLGAIRVVDELPADPVAATEQSFRVLRAGESAYLPFDAELTATQLTLLRQLARTTRAEPLAVRLRPTTRASRLRDRLRGADVPGFVLDARAILDEGEAHDVAETNDPVRLRRVARRLRTGGYQISGVFNSALDRIDSLDDGATPRFDGNRVTVELDNARARAWLVDEIARSRQSVNFQVYMAADDEIGRAVEAALAGAAERGVTVRLLVDSVHGLHGSFGAENPLLSRLGARPGITLRVSQPLAGIPEVSSIKQRDHRKVVIIDDAVALVGGRNLSYEYYTGFHEARLRASTPWHKVPWLDAGARIEGPAVVAIASAFLVAWTEAGGASFRVVEPPPIGSTAARVVVHRGLQDARTLETYLELIEQARRHIYAVNGFPHVLELQHALLGALRRGVRVRALTGHVTPMHDQTPFSGPWSAARNTATELVHSRLDPIVEQGGEVYLFAQRGLPGWEPGLGIVHPHVHAKLMSVDGLRCAVGSANFDVTSAYWESELMLVVDDPAIASELETTLDHLLAGSTRVDRADPAWRERALRRRWMRWWPGVLAL
jgi:phosphatidylserine/phosphatidylglycerophosphate/cardiolipin synthase-like enzyme